MRGHGEVQNELRRIFNHVGLNPNDTLELSTTYRGYEFTTTVRGVNLHLARAALTTFLMDRRGATAVILDDALVVTQRG